MNHSHLRKGTAGSPGFSLIELMVSLVILTVVFAIAMHAMVEMVQRKSVENNKIDLVQESREFMDQITNDIHQSGYPSPKMFDYTTMAVSACGQLPGFQMYVGPTVNNPVANSCPPNVATGATALGSGVNGLVSLTKSSVQFEADVDGTGVSEVFIQLVQSNGAGAPACATPPCVIQRGTTLKVNYIAGNPVFYYTELNNVMNTDVFKAYDNLGNPVALPAPPGPLTQITDVGITLYVKASSPDPKTGVYPTATMVSDAKIRLN